MLNSFLHSLAPFVWAFPFMWKMGVWFATPLGAEFSIAIKLICTLNSLQMISIV